MPPKVRSLRLANKTFDFVHVPLHFVDDRCEDVFANKNNKTLRETLAHPRYASLAATCAAKYSQHLDSPLGEVLLQLKVSGDAFYKQFLNRYGDLAYSTFTISDPSALGAQGVYAYYSNDVLVYIGRCKDSMRKRVNQGYGKIHPKNCFRGGQATNCHLNARIAAATSDVTLWLCQMDNRGDIEAVDCGLIREYAPPWNIQRG